MNYLLKALPERREAEMVPAGSRLLQMLHLDSGGHGIPGGAGWVRHRRRLMVPRRRAAAPSTVPPTLLLQLQLMRGCRGSNARACRRGPAALPGLRLVEDLAHHELSFLLLLEVAKVVLVHHPVGLLGLAVLAEVCVEHQDLLAALLPPAGHHWPGLASLVPPGLAFLYVALRLDLPPLPGPRRVGFGWPVEEVLA